MGDFMGEVANGAIIGGVIGALVGVVIFAVAMLRPGRRCPDCDEELPRIRKPANRKQALWGGTTCPHCGCEIDRRGRRVDRGK